MKLELPHCNRIPAIRANIIIAFNMKSVFITKSGDSQLTKNHCQNHNERRKEVRSPATAVGD